MTMVQPARAKRPRLWAQSSMLRSPDEVRGFQATIDPQPNESLFGFFFRTLSGTAVRRPFVGAALAGIDLSGRYLTKQLRLNPDHVNQLATLLGVDPQEILTRVTTETILAGGRRAWNSFGVPIRTSLWLPESKRRVSPRALEKSQHHRAIWDIAPLTFDPETFELLLSTCPVCHAELGWRQANGVHMCDRCLDRTGMPNVDLRDFPQALVEPELRETLGFVAGLVDPAAERVHRSTSMVVPRWASLSSGELFDAIVDIAMACVSERSDHRLATGPIALRQITPEAMARAGDAFLAEDGFEQLAATFRAEETSRRGHRGMMKSFGTLSSLAGPNSQVHPLIRDSLAAITRAHSRTKYGYAAHPHHMDPRQLSREFGLSWTRFHRLADSGEVSVLRTSDQKNSTRLLLVSEVAPLVERAVAAVPLRKASQILSIPEGAVDILREGGILTPIVGAVRGLLGTGDYFAREDVEALLGYVWEGAHEVGSVEGLPDIVTLLGHPAGQPRLYAMALLALTSGGAGAVYAGCSPKRWTRDLKFSPGNDLARRIAEAEAQFARHLDPERLLSAKETAEKLRVTLMSVRALKISGYLTDRGTKIAQFRADEVDVFQREYATFNEAKELLKAKPSDVRRWFAVAGFGPVEEFDGSPGAIFERRALNWLVRARQAGYVRLNGISPPR